MLGMSELAVESTQPRHAGAAPRVDRDRAPACVLGLLILGWIVVFTRLAWLKHSRFASVDFDMGIHDQSIWLLAHLRGFMTVRGLQVFGHHATFGYLVFVPFSWLGAGVQFLNASQVVVEALGAVPVYLLVRHRTGEPWAGVALGAVYLLHPALQFFTAELFHPEVLAITPLLCAYYCSVRRRWRWFTLWAVLAVCWKEDVALAVAVIGLIIAIRGDRKIGCWTIGLALGWFLMWTVALFPIINDGKIQSEGLYSDVGGTPSGIASTEFTDPGSIASKLASTDAREYGWRLFAPFGFTGLLAPLTLLVGVPQAFLNLITNVPWTKTIRFHYAAIPLAAVTIASMEGISFAVRRLRTQGARALLVVAVLACAVVSTRAWGPSPIGDEYRGGAWALGPRPRQASADAAIAKIPPADAVSASYNLVPHLSERAEIYTFPNPWRSSNFGIEGEPRRSPRPVDWIVVDVTVLDADTRDLLDRLLASRFKLVSQHDGYVVAKRR
jgi:uncharacterized membrane protein